MLPMLVLLSVVIVGPKVLVFLEYVKAKNDLFSQNK